LAAHPPGAPVIKLWISAVPAPPRSAQRGLFLHINPEPEKLEITLARISAIVGERRAGIARLLDSHRRDSSQVERFVSISQDETVSTTMSDANELTLAMRLIRPAWQLQVQVLEGRPSSLAAESRRPGRDNLQGRILWSAGPWRSSGDWWTENGNGKNPSGAWDREEWDIALAIASHGSKGTSGESQEDQNVALYRIYHDVGTGQWFADASYD